MAEVENGDEHPRLWQAVQEVVLQVIDQETEFDAEKLEQKVRSYFQRGARKMDLKCGRPWHELIREFADNVFGSLWSGLGDRDWLQQVDFQACFHLAIQEVFPGRVLKNVTEEKYQEVMAAEADRANDEQRYGMNKFKIVGEVISGMKTTKKVNNAVDVARAEAREAAPGSADEFLQAWIASTLNVLAEGGNPRDVMDEDKAVELFQALVNANCLPVALVEGGNPDVDAEVVAEAYSQYPPAGEEMPSVAPAGMARPTVKPSMAGVQKGAFARDGYGGGGAYGGGYGGGYAGGAVVGGYRSGAGAYGSRPAQNGRRGAYPVESGGADWGAPAKRACNGW